MKWMIHAWSSRQACKPAISNGTAMGLCWRSQVSWAPLDLVLHWCSSTLTVVGACISCLRNCCTSTVLLMQLFSHQLICLHIYWLVQVLNAMRVRRSCICKSTHHQWFQTVRSTDATSLPLVCLHANTAAILLLPVDMKLHSS